MTEFGAWRAGGSYTYIVVMIKVFCRWLKHGDNRMTFDENYDW